MVLTPKRTYDWNKSTSLRHSLHKDYLCPKLVPSVYSGGRKPTFPTSWVGFFCQLQREGGLRAAPQKPSVSSRDIDVGKGRRRERATQRIGIKPSEQQWPTRMSASGRRALKLRNGWEKGQKVGANFEPCVSRHWVPFWPWFFNWLQFFVFCLKCFRIFCNVGYLQFYSK